MCSGWYSMYFLIIISNHGALELKIIKPNDHFKPFLLSIFLRQLNVYVIVPVPLISN